MHQWKNYEIGVCYYPEQWDESLWREDLQRIKAAGISTVRVAEFAWMIFEPVEGNFPLVFLTGFLIFAKKKKSRLSSAPRQPLLPPG